MNPFAKFLRKATRLTQRKLLSQSVATVQRTLAASQANLRPLTGWQDRPPGGHAEPANDPSVTAGFHAASYASDAGMRPYKLFVPEAATDGGPLPLVVMLHGCTQDPDDFAAGTRMNELGQERGFLVLYPQQAPRSNASKCWNWFRPGDQRRGEGEPALIAGMTRHVMATYDVDASRVYVAGLSAGGAMAAILGREYPDLFAAVGVHSGLPQGAAHDVASAFSAMKNGPSGKRPRAAATSPRDKPGAPAIVFHGDSDSTVHPVNGQHVIADLVQQAAAATPERSTQAQPAASRGFTRTTYRDAQGRSHAELWEVHGAGHAWSGGSSAGSYTDAAGPDATREMLRFFDEHPRAAAA
jgi:poly(hydroxyalkanoate) depolymerase family esterase